MVTFTAKLIKVGNSHSIIVPAPLVSSGLLVKGEELEVEIKTRHDRIVQENDDLKRKLKSCEVLLKEKGLDSLFNKTISKKDSEKFKEELKRNSGGRI